MKLELAEGGNRRRRNLQDSSLFSFRLADHNSQNMYLTIPDPAGNQSPVKVRIDYFDSVPNQEFEKIVAYSAPFNYPEVIDAALSYRGQLGDDPPYRRPSTTEYTSAHHAVTSIFDRLHPKTSFWDSKILGIPTKYAVPGALGLYLILKH